ncbi:unnamed protein product [Polarella glacialis]|uniref:Uncharacterized protein n=1 Tax=Polarella glacialis TaxID=89957 RepID=A0A813HZD0_POLGL|nr:unnamed protein product [Polarella glacialis]
MAELNAAVAMIYPIWGGLMLMLTIARLAHAAFRAGRGGMLSPIAKRLRLLIRGCAPVAGAAQPIDKLVKEVGLVQNAERISRSLVWMHPIYALSVACQVSFWVFDFGFDSQHRYNFFSYAEGGSSNLAQLLVFTMTVGTVYYPAWVTPLRLIFCHVLLTITCAVSLALEQSILQWSYHILWVTIIRTGFGVIHGDKRVTIANNAVFSLAMLVFVQLRWGMTLVLFQTIVIPSIFICILSVFVEQSRESELRATLEAKASKELETSVEAVLATICDAVVLLSISFRLLRPSPHLAGMLLRSSSSAVFMTGGNFIDLLVESDRDAFLQFMGDPSTHAKMLHAHMRDANSSAVAVHFYHTKYLDLEGQPVHIIGIREDSEENRPQPLPQELQSSLSRQVVDEVWDRAHESRASSNNNSNNNRSTASSISGSSDPMPLVEGDHAMSRCVWVDASSIDLMMVKCTPEFSAWSGPSGLNVGLLNWVVPVDQSNFYDFFHMALNHYVQCAQDGSESVGPGSIVLKLKPPHWGRSIETEAEIAEFCAGRSNSNDNNNNEGRTEDSLSEPRILGCVSFKSVRMTRTTQKRSKRTSRLAAAAAKSAMARPSSSAVASSSAGSAGPKKLQL